MPTKVKGSTWCPSCNKTQPSVLTGLVSFETYQEVRGICQVCKQAVSKKIEKRKRQTLTIATEPKPTYRPIEKSNSVFKSGLLRLFTYVGATYIIYQTFGYVLEVAFKS